MTEADPHSSARHAIVGSLTLDLPRRTQLSMRRGHTRRLLLIGPLSARMQGWELRGVAGCDVTQRHDQAPSTSADADMRADRGDRRRLQRSHPAVLRSDLAAAAHPTRGACECRSFRMSLCDCRSPSRPLLQLWPVLLSSRRATRAAVGACVVPFRRPPLRSPHAAHTHTQQAESNQQTQISTSQHSTTDGQETESRLSSPLPLPPLLVTPPRRSPLAASPPPQRSQPNCAHNTETREETGQI